MASIFTGYANDIFVSYRQKDNRSEQWVTNLQGVVLRPAAGLSPLPGSRAVLMFSLNFQVGEKLWVRAQMGYNYKP